MVKLRVNKDPKISFGERLRSLRNDAGLSQEALGHIANVDRTYVSSCERGKRNVTLEIIVRFAIALEIPPGSLLSDIQLPGGQP